MYYCRYYNVPEKISQKYQELLNYLYLNAFTAIGRMLF